ncbi:TIGR04282 family arsenosugar biosynthesis glycosyltransferase [Actinoplanes couchii]|uniref:Glycosyltransferase n=1 Tax=Actinoplanes couchii TaxID=403638 RepID=A0ABQ3XE26_9ACTN|nr:DUF2064 domain-containing protein [Actinoplanes couchii]MDR6317259.1 glycosyltransferase A (GT-A) superfamily protein (DUF2064 family) [Actinoplanes couchii]GID56752.1 hypothetical protein Aco03nite_051560 [Actinoplanes couchii]
MRAAQLLLLAKAPVPGRVKTRLCPPCTPEQAALVAAAALTDTLAAGTACAARTRVLVVDGVVPAPPRWNTLPQRGDVLGDRLANAFADTRRAGTATVLIGMDTPQITAAHLDAAFTLLGAAGGPDAVLGTAGEPDAVLGTASDGGWWALGLRDPGHAEVLRHIPTSVDTTGARTLAALRARGLRVAPLPVLCDVDTADDARRVAALCPPGGLFATAVTAHVPAPAGASR